MINTISTINTINIINFINQYKDNQCDRSDLLTLQTSPTQFHRCCLLFLFAWLIKVRIIVVLHTISSCWYTHFWFIFWLCLRLNPTVVPTIEVRLLSQRGMDYCCVYRGQLFLTGFILLIEPSSCVKGAINCNKEDLTIMSSHTQDDDHQFSYVK